MAVTSFDFRVIGTDDPYWDSTWERLPDDARDVFYSQAYANVNQKRLLGRHRVRAAVASIGDQVILYPFVVRRLADLPGLEGIDNNLHDIRGLYGRSGPVGAISICSLMKRFSAALIEYLLGENVIASFDRLHPLANGAEEFGQPFSTVETGSEVIVDLRIDDETLWRSFRPSVRKNSRKATVGGVLCSRREGEKAWADFTSLYAAAMRSKGAADFYYFNREYFDDIRQLLQGNASLYLAEVDGRTVSGELVLHNGRYAHSFLGGTDFDWQHLQPNTLLKTHIIGDLRKRGFSSYLLGGGLTRDDGVYAYKKSFAPLGVVKSSILVGLFNGPAYEDLRAALVAKPFPVAENRFQFYDLE